MKRRDIFRGFASLLGAASVAPLAPAFASGGVVASTVNQIVFNADQFAVTDGEAVTSIYWRIASADGAMVFDSASGTLTINAARHQPA